MLFRLEKLDWMLSAWLSGYQSIQSVGALQGQLWQSVIWRRVYFFMEW